MAQKQALSLFFANKQNLDEFKKSDLCKQLLIEQLKVMNNPTTADILCGVEYFYFLHRMSITNNYAPYIQFLKTKFIEEKLIEFVDFDKNAFDEYANCSNRPFRISEYLLQHNFIGLFEIFMGFITASLLRTNEMETFAYVFKSFFHPYPTVLHIFLCINPEYVKMCKTYQMRKMAIAMIYDEMCNGFERHPFADDYIVHKIVRYMHVKIDANDGVSVL